MTEIRIEIDQHTPPCGCVVVRHEDGTVPGTERVEFVGWLGLLRVLSEAIEETRPVTP